MLIAIGLQCGDHGFMSEARIQELELQLVAAHASLATAQASIATLTASNIALTTSAAELTAANTKLTGDVADSEVRAKKARRSAKRDESSFRDQLATANNRRF